MLLQLEDTNKENLDKLLVYAKQHQLQFSLVDDSGINLHLPGRPLSEDELTSIIEKSRKSGKIEMRDALDMIKKSTKW